MHEWWFRGSVHVQMRFITQYAIDSNKNAKLVDIHWNCKRPKSKAGIAHDILLSGNKIGKCIQRVCNIKGEIRDIAMDIGCDFKVVEVGGKYKIW